jgi:hypothetical protein
MTTTEITNDYLAVAFGIERHFPGYVDAYFGPPELKEQANSGDSKSPEELRAMAESLGVRVTEADIDGDRKQYLLAQARAMETIARKLSGEPIGYLEEVIDCFDIIPERTPESLFESAIAELDELLPGEGSVADRITAWRRQSVISVETARTLIDIILQETRRRTEQLVQLPDGESVEIQFVTDQPWSGYNWYLGDARSRVEINTDLPIYALDLVGLIAHEAYPGHHTEHSLKDKLLYQKRGYVEMAVQLINTPECVIHEGIATVAESIIFPGYEAARWKAEVLYPAADLKRDPEQEEAIDGALKRLRAVEGNAALLRHVDGAPEDDVVAYLMRYTLRPEEEARQRLRFIDDPLWSPYIFTYHIGRDLLLAWLANFSSGSETVASKFVELLQKPATPSMLRSQLPH